MPRSAQTILPSHPVAGVHVPVLRLPSETERDIEGQGEREYGRKDEASRCTCTKAAPSKGATSANGRGVGGLPEAEVDGCLAVYI